jgi:hypothetical protein
MATFYSPKIVTDGLVLALDAANIKSFRGEPTTNLIQFPLFIDGSGNSTTSGYANFGFGDNNTLSVSELPSALRLGKSCRVIKNTTTFGTINNTVSITPLVFNDTITVSWYARGIDDTIGKLVRIWGFSNSSAGAISTGLTTLGPLTENWQRFSYTYTWTREDVNSFASFVSYIRVEYGTGTEFLVSEPQVERRPTLTPFVNGTRGTTVATGGGWADLAGNANHGELVNGPTYNSSNGGSLVFDGTNDAIDIGSTNNLTGNNAQILTVSMWLKYATTVTELRALTLLRSAGSSLLGVFCNATIINNVVTPSLGSLGFFTRNFDNSAHSSVTFNDNYHLKDRYINVTSVVNGMNRYLYIDGIQKSSDSDKGMQSVTNNTAASYIGAGPAGPGNQPWDGLVANVMIYNRALTPQEILQNFNATRSRFGV